jgi:hypothetical protein
LSLIVDVRPLLSYELSHKEDTGNHD